MFGYKLLSSLSCVENDGKLRTPCLKSNTVPLGCHRSPIKGLAKLEMTMNCSRKVKSQTLYCNSVFAIGISNCPLATMIWTSGGGRPFWIFWGKI